MKVTFLLDVRSSQLAPHSGVGRFTQSLASGIAAELKSNPPTSSNCRMILVGTRELGENLAHFVGHADSPAVPLEETQGTKGASSAPVSWWGMGSQNAWWVRKPRALWSTLVLWVFVFRARRNREGYGTLVWIAPDNIDRPLLAPGPLKVKAQSSDGPPAVTLVQIVHDLIPFRYPSAGNRWLRLQFRILMGPWFRRGTRFVAISGRTRRDLQAVLPKDAVSPFLLANRLGPGLVAALNAMATLEPREVWEELRTHLPGWREFLDDVAHVSSDSEELGFWLGVGRDEAYKNWGTLGNLRSGGAAQSHHNLWILHICTSESPGGLYESLTRLPEPFVSLGRCTVYPGRRLVRIHAVSDRTLAALYRVSDALLHPSLAEGYGLPLAEAYLAGLPIFAGQENGFSEVLEELEDREEVHFFDAQWDAARLLSLLDGAPRWEERLLERTRRSALRFKSPRVQDLLVSNVSMGRMAIQAIREVLD